MSRPSINTRPARDIAGVVSDMLGKKPLESSREIREETKTARGKSVEVEELSRTESAKREKTSFALRPNVKRHLSLLKLDLRSNGHKITEAEIVEILIDAATTSSVLEAFRQPQRTE